MRTACLYPLLTSSSGRVAVVKGELLPLLGIGSWSSNCADLALLRVWNPDIKVYEILVLMQHSHDMTEQGNEKIT
jgi:hypothetical protein